ncbi:MAG: 16S rRNA processing protein RimM [Desulfuromonadales bacterium C00003093]|nr:MAG: 16S rRNA processing protein RimM [Desulfuromonadales bacterium C00003093]
MAVDSSLVVLGRIVKAHGTRGELKVHLYSESDALSVVKTIFIHSLEGKKVRYGVIKARANKAHGAILAVEGVFDRAQAEAFVGMEISVEKALLPRLDAEEYYWYELEGLSVVNVAGMKLGLLSDIMATSGHDVYIVQGSMGEILVPAVEQVVKEIDLEKGLMVVDLPPGLVESNAL